MELSDSVLDHLRSVAALPDLSGTRYELEGEIGRGGMGIVYAARDRVLDRRVALKVLDLTPAGEAQLIAALEHPAIVPVYEAGTLPDGREFYAMKLIKGARLDVEAALHVVIQRGNKCCLAVKVDAFEFRMALLNPGITDGLIHLMEKLVDSGCDNLIHGALAGSDVRVLLLKGFRRVLMLIKEPVSLQNGRRLMLVVRDVHMLHQLFEKHD